MTGAAPVPVPPPMPAVMNTMFEPCIASRMSSTASSAAARPTSGRAPAPSPRVTPVPSWILRGAADSCSACASVLQTTNSQPIRFDRIMLLTALPPAPPTPMTVMRGFSSCSSLGMLRLIMISPLHACAAVMMPRPRPARLGREPARSDRRGSTRRLRQIPLRSPDGAARYYRLPERGTRSRAGNPSKLRDFRASSARPAPKIPPLRDTRRARRFGALRQREMQQPGGGRKRRTVRRLGQPLDPHRPADPDLLVEDEPGEFARPVHLAGAAGQHDAAAGDLVAAARVEPVAHQLEGLLEARRDDADEQRFRHMADLAVFLFADLRHRDHLALVERR